MLNLNMQSGIIWDKDTQRYDTVQDCACVMWEPGSTSTMVDCACADSTLALTSKRPILSGSWVQAPEVLLYPLARGFTVAFTPTTKAPVTVLDNQALTRLRSYRTAARLSTDADRTLAQLGLLVPAAAYEACPEQVPETFTVWLSLTNMCNLSCPYCYIPKTAHNMTLETGRLALQRIFSNAQRRQFRRVKIKYAGGEPGLCFDGVKALHAVAEKLSSERGIELQEVVLSNGTLLSASQLQWLAEENVSLMISLDGVGEVHNRLRSDPSTGQGTFTKVADTIDTALKEGVKLYISTTVSAWNVMGLADVVRFSLDRGLLPHLNLVRTSNAAMIPPEAQLLTSMQTVMEEFQDANFPFMSGFFDLAVFSPHRYACGVGKNYLVIGPNGGLFPCQMKLNTEIGSIFDEDGPLSRMQQGDPFNSLAVDQRTDCATCAWRYICAGGCPLLTQVYGHNPYCAIYKRLLPELVHLEGERILKSALLSV